MILQNIKRVLKWGVIGFVRNSTVSFSSVLVMVVALLMIGSTMLTSAGLDAVLKDLENKVDVNVYFTIEASEDQIFDMQRSFEALEGVSTVTYTPRDQVLADFKERHKNDETTLQALTELNENPFGAILTIKADSADKYDTIGAVISSKSIDPTDGTKSIIDRNNYSNKKPVIDTLNNIIAKVRFGGIAIAIVLVAISILITYNTIRLAIYISKDEISVMRLVGAGKAYIRGPFIVEGVMYGIVASIIALGLFYPITLTIRNQTQDLFGGGINPYKYFISNFTEIFLVIFLSGVTLGIVSSYLAVRKYLKD